MDRFYSWCKVIASVIQCQLSAMQALNIQIYLFFSIWQVDSNQGFSWVLFLLEIKKDNCTSLMQKDNNKRGVYCMIISTEINQQKCPHWSLRIECCSWLLLWYNHTYFWINMFFCQSLSLALPQFSSVLFFK